MIFRLIILNGERNGQQVNVPPEPLIIGRGPDAGLVLQDPEVASAHASVEHLDGSLVIRDLGSMGKILINNHEVRESGLVHGDVIEIGRTRLLVQAVVEADVQSPNAPRRTRPRRRRSAVPLLLLLLALSAGAYVQQERARARASIRDWSRPLSTGQPLQDLAEIVAAVESEVPTEAPPVVPAPPPPPPTTTRPEATPPAPQPEPPDPYVLARDLLTVKVQNKMLEAQLLIASNRYVEADRLLGSIQQIAPEFAPSYAERAWLFEDRGMLQPALDQWHELIRVGGDAELLSSAQAKIAQLVLAREKELPKFADQLRVVSTDQRRFPDSGNGAEMRLVTIRVAAADQGPTIQADAVRVHILYFDQDTTTGSIRRSRISGPVEPQGSLSPWPAGDTKTLTASYVVPARTAGDAAERPEHYYGHLVRIFYHGALQDQFAQPKSILDLITATVPADGGKTVAAQAATP